MAASSFLELIHHVILGLAIPGVALSGLLLVAIAFLQWNPVSRPYLDRVSFRVIFGSVMLPPLKGPSPSCTLVAFLYATAPMFSACLFCCMAVNLQLVLIHGVNGNKMEKYYLLAAAFLSAACNIPPLAAGVFGWYAPAAKCWLRVTPVAQRHWMVGTQSVPMILMSAIEVFCFMNILIFTLLRARTRTETSGSASATLASTLPKHPIVRFRPSIVRIEYKYTDIECAYPTAEIPSPATLMYVPIVDSCVYSIRPLLYALLAATDPAFLRAIQSLRQEIEPSSQWVSSPRSHSQTATAVSLQ
ncbi:hypothetical protein B0H13DRAFT_2683893 [Mycena leptocephala]|nr:hypothetical protein B0H13DRAFT_2683893 [Mycena leptocephala]